MNMEKIEVDKIYSKDECMSRLVSKLREELMDVISYNNLYESLMAHRHYEDAKDIEYIARQEYHHAQIIYDLLEDDEVEARNSTDIKSLWETVKDIFDEE